MNRERINGMSVVVWGIFSCITSAVLANGGPFVVKYPDGDPAAKGVFARIDPDLKPGIERQLRVVKEDLKLDFAISQAFPRVEGKLPPLVQVCAEYTIENPGEKEVEVDFGFPILRGIYTHPYSMMPRPDVHVQLGEKGLGATVISNSVIYGIIRQRARDVVEKAVGEDQELGKLVTSVRNAGGESREEARQSLLSHLTDVMKWDERNAALMVEYAGLNLGKPRSFPPDRGHYTFWSPDMAGFAENNLGALSAIGEQKATHFFAQLASAFEPGAGQTYESIFAAWGGDVRERSVDLTSGQVRPREISVDTDMPGKRSAFGNAVDPTIYARVDYLDPEAKISEEEKAACKQILKNLPVIFTFAPMNIIHYRAKFAPHSTEKLTVTYSQYAYSDTKAPSTYQLAYVLHPASLWESFGPINLEVTVPAGMGLKASAPCELDATEERTVSGIPGVAREQRDVYRGIIEEKTGELFVAVDADRWQSIIKQAQRQSIRAGKSPQRTQQVSKGKGA